jgi:hypothetical protein
MDSKKIGFWSGILLFIAILIFFNPDDLSQRGQITAAVFIHPLQESHLGGLLIDLNSS